MSYWAQSLVLVIFSTDGRVLCAHSAHAQTGTALSRLQFPIVPFKKIAQGRPHFRSIFCGKSLQRTRDE